MDVMRRGLLILIVSLLVAIIVFSLDLDVQSFFPRRDERTLVLYGNIDIRQVDLSFEVGGRVTEMQYQEGDQIPLGALIGKIDAENYVDRVSEVRAALESVQAALVNAERLVKRRKELVGVGGVSAQDYDDAVSQYEVQFAKRKEQQARLKLALADLGDTELFSPVEGTVLTRVREPGSVIISGEPIYTVSLPSPLWVRAFVAEPQLGEIYPGMPAIVKTDSSTKEYHGQIGFISPVAEFTPKTVETSQLRTDLVYRLRVIVSDPDESLRQGMPVTVLLERSTGKLPPSEGPSGG